jgi:large subunit ribosomal protein L5
MSIKEKYQKDVIPEMQKQFGYSNRHQVPKIDRAIINVGVGKLLKDPKQIDDIEEALRSISGQKPIRTKAKISIAGFKTRQGMEIGVKVTLRGKRMWDFLNKLVNVTLPRIRDFRGIKKSSIGQAGNINIGIKEHLVFPEIIPENVRNVFSLQVTITNSANSRREGEKLFRLLGFPIEE